MQQYFIETNDIEDYGYISLLDDLDARNFAISNDGKCIVIETKGKCDIYYKLMHIGTFDCPYRTITKIGSGNHVYLASQNKYRIKVTQINFINGVTQTYIKNKAMRAGPEPEFECDCESDGGSDCECEEGDEDYDCEIGLDLDELNSQIYVRHENLLNKIQDLYVFDMEDLDINYTINNIEYMSDKYVFVKHEKRYDIYDIADGARLATIDLANPSIYNICEHANRDIFVLGYEMYGKYYVFDTKDGYLGKVRDGMIQIGKIYLDKYEIIGHTQRIHQYNIASLRIAEVRQTFLMGSLRGNGSLTNSYSNHSDRDSSITRFTSDALYDSHLMGEIFKFLPDPYVL